ncbi:MAG TPA: prenyltransferase/squalene oxidase repeat-containing protein [Urbifossiella sp.]|nr:prenyltransferase/squalene oxidase repeat-containing protein [Urbifossiella sp.]
MNRAFALLLTAFAASLALAQTADIQKSVDQKLATLRFLKTLQRPNGGFAPGPKQEQANLSDTIAAVRALHYVSGKPVAEAVPNVKDTVGFVMACYDPKTGSFADMPNGKPSSVALTSIGVMVAVDLSIPRDKYSMAMDYLKDNVKTFEDARIAAAAIEAWGVKNCPFDLKPWIELADKHLGPTGAAGEGDAMPRETGSAAALKLRLGIPRRKFVNPTKLDDVLQAGQWSDGGYGRGGAKGSDLESTYRVMRAFMLMKERPKKRAAMREFIASCRNKDGGYGVKPGEASSAGGTYFAAIVTHWLDDMEK